MESNPSNNCTLHSLEWLFEIGATVSTSSRSLLSTFFFFFPPSPSKIASRGEMGRRVYVFALARYHNGVVGNFDRFVVLCLLDESSSIDFILWNEIKNVYKVKS